MAALCSLEGYGDEELYGDDDPETAVLFGFNDELGEELLGSFWKKLKSRVSRVAKKAKWMSPTYQAYRAGKFAVGKRKNAKWLVPGYAPYRAGRAIVRGEDDADYKNAVPIDVALMGYNDEAGEELLGASFWKRLKRKVKKVTHKALNVGAKYGPEKLQAVIKGGRAAVKMVNSKATKKAKKAVKTVMDNKYKFILGGVVVVGLIAYISGKRRGR